MAPEQGPSHLSVLVDQLWRHPSEREVMASRLVTELTSDDWLVLAGWDTAASFGPDSGQLTLKQPNQIEVSDSWGRPFLRATLEAGGKAGRKAPIITYPKAGLVVRVAQRSANTLNARVERDPASLLLALEYIRYRLDSDLWRPLGLRNPAIREAAAAVGLEEDHFRRLATWFTVLAPYL